MLDNTSKVHSLKFLTSPNVHYERGLGIMRNRDGLSCNLTSTKVLRYIGIYARINIFDRGVVNFYFQMIERSLIHNFQTGLFNNFPPKNSVYIVL